MDRIDVALQPPPADTRGGGNERRTGDRDQASRSRLELTGPAPSGAA